MVVWLALIFGGIALVLTLVAAPILLRPPSRVDLRLRQLAAPVPTATTSEDTPAVQSLLGPRFQELPVVERMARALWQAGFNVSATDFLLIVLGCVLAGFLAGMLLLQRVIAGVGLGLIGGLLPLAALWFAKSRRRAALETQLPDVLSFVAAALRSGNSFLQAFQLAAREMDPPISQELGQVTEEISIGIPVDDALLRMVARVNSYDLDMAVTAILIQRQVGGNLAQLLDTIAETIRERFRIRGEIAALTAEGRLSGVILFLMPIGLMGFLAIANPDYMSPLWTHPMGKLLLLGAVLLQAIGGFLIYRMLQLESA